MATRDYPSWVYDPTGVNPPQVVPDDPGFVRLSRAPLRFTKAPTVGALVAPVVVNKTPHIVGTR